MIKKIAFGGLGLALLISPAFALAQVDVQSQIASLLAQIKQLQALIQQLQGQSSTPVAGTSSCLDLNNALVVGSTDATTNGEVSKLQQFLVAAGAYPEARITGYYGTLTAQAVVRWQKAHGMDFVTLASGVGPMTRAKLRETCSTGSAQTVSVNISVSGLNPPTISLLNGTTVLGQKYLRVRNTTDAIDTALGISLSGNGLGESCVDTVQASLEIANPKVDTNSITMHGDPVVGVDVVRVISHGSPQHNCAT